MQSKGSKQGETFAEWLAVNQGGSFAMGSPDRVPRRKYHALLMARYPEWDEPHHVLGEVNEVILDTQAGYELAAFAYETTIHPEGFKHLASFEHQGQPTWTYQCGPITVVRRLSLDPQAAAVYLDYDIQGASAETEMLIYPYFGCRSYHRLSQENALLDGRIEDHEQGVVTQFYQGFPKLIMGAGQEAKFELSGFWNQRLFYREEQERGYPAYEDLFCPGAFRIFPGRTPRFRFFCGSLRDIAQLQTQLPPRPKATAKKKPAKKSFYQRLQEAASDYLYQPKPGEKSIIAGYPWFGSWGRDTFIALAGLTLTRGDLKTCDQVLKTWAKYRLNGLIPNVASNDFEKADPYSIDASLWYIRALQQFDLAGGKIQPHVETLFGILEALLKPKVRHVHIRPSGLLYAACKPRPMTWMDASINGIAVTPRSPFAIDVNALFYNGICYALDVEKRFPRPGFTEVWRPLADHLKATLIEAFYLPDQGYLADAHNGLEPDSSLRPNQLAAFALPYRAFDDQIGVRVIDIIRDKLLTPFGLRTLSPDHPDYRGLCRGSQQERDAAYHQGTVWPWLSGLYIDAVLNIKGTDEAVREAERILDGIAGEADRCCFEHINEIYDGDAPHTPRGAPAQAWSVAEILRIAQVHDSLKPAKRKTRGTAKKG